MAVGSLPFLRSSEYLPRHYLIKPLNVPVKCIGIYIFKDVGAEAQVDLN